MLTPTVFFGDFSRITESLFPIDGLLLVMISLFVWDGNEESLVDIDFDLSSEVRT